MPPWPHPSRVPWTTVGGGEVVGELDALRVRVAVGVALLEKDRVGVCVAGGECEGDSEQLGVVEGVCVIVGALLREAVSVPVADTELEIDPLRVGDAETEPERLMLGDPLAEPDTLPLPVEEVVRVRSGVRVSEPLLLWLREAVSLPDGVVVPDEVLAAVAVVVTVLVGVSVEETVLVGVSVEDTVLVGVPLVVAVADTVTVGVLLLVFAAVRERDWVRCADVLSLAEALGEPELLPDAD